MHRKEHGVSVCETPRSFVSQTAGPRPLTRRVTRPPTAGPELPSLGSALPPLIRQNA